MFLTPLIEGIASVFYNSYEPRRKWIFDKKYYHPLWGVDRKVNHPSVPVKTFFPSQIPDIHTIGKYRQKHIMSKPIYQMAWEQRKNNSSYNYGYIAKNSRFINNRVPLEERGRLQGLHISSRIKDGNRKWKRDKWYQQVKANVY